jgi:ribose transport system ATP-binding protein
MTTLPVLAVRGLSKRFGGTLALDDVSLTLRPGEIHALVGENGAGKSTLIKVLAGVYKPDNGRIEVGGHLVHPHLANPAIAFVHQDLGLVDELTVGENIAFLLGWPKRLSFIDWKQVARRAKDAYARMGLTPPKPDSPVGIMSTAEKALLAIVRALAANASALVLDEATAPLPGPDVEELFKALRKLRESGTGILYVTHRLGEVFAIADEVTVLRGGKKVDEGSTSAFTLESLVAAMLGRDVGEKRASPMAAQPATEAPIVTVSGLVIDGKPPVSFDVYSGEILGLVGLRGAGHEHIGRAMAGADPCDRGEVSVCGDVIGPSAHLRSRVFRGIGLLPADRQRESAFFGLSVVENLFPVGSNSSGMTHWISHRHERMAATELIEEYAIRPPRGELLMDQLSGGNQQKVCVARLLARAHKLMVLEEPTAGVDVGARVEIHEYIREEARGGTGVIVILSDFEEVATLCTRALVIVNGAVAAEVGADEMTPGLLLVLASSGSPLAVTASELVAERGEHVQRST